MIAQQESRLDVAVGPVQKSKSYFNLIQVFRGFAAVWVVLYHADLTVDAAFGAEFAGGIFETGFLGVDFFFVLSGFIIAYAHAGDLGNASVVPKYLKRRVSRIYPLVAVLTTLKLGYGLLLGIGVPPEKLNLDTYISSYLLLPVSPDSGGRLIDVTWTLSYEMLFYFVFLAGLFYGRRALLMTLGLWSVAAVAYSFTPMTSLDFMKSFVLNAHAAQFTMGVGIAFALQAIKVSPKLSRGLLAVGAIALFLGISLGMGDTANLTVSARALYWGVTFALLVAGAVFLEANSPLKVPALLNYLGKASFSIYLAHTSAQQVLVEIGRKAGTENFLTSQGGMWALVVVSVVGGCACYELVERPLNAAFRKSEKLKSGTPPPETSQSDRELVSA